MNRVNFLREMSKLPGEPIYDELFNGVNRIVKDALHARSADLVDFVSMKARKEAIELWVKEQDYNKVMHDVAEWLHANIK